MTSTRPDRPDVIPVQETRARSGQSAPRGRMLVVEPDQEATRDRTARLPVTVEQLGRIREALGAAGVGAHFARSLGSLACLIREADDAVHELIDGVGELPRAGIQARARTIAEILDWMRAEMADFETAAENARNGKTQVDTLRVLQEVVAVGRFSETHPELRIALPPLATGGSDCLARPAAVAEMLHLALVLVSRRIGNQGSVRIEIERVDDVVVHRFVGIGHVGPVVGAEEVATLRRLVLAEHGGVLTSLDASGHQSGMAIELPAAPDRAS